ncbi:hypothetical protein ACJDU8_17575 [Clostridium sp. WILCCON 0269]|uniref:Uncharacterized protein n=1 Tax=Candidatus Clostridium eludens TaxID=3381663 RepID=A0ABW8SPS4_9CLOT
MIEVISKEKSSKIIDTRKPYGLFLILNKDGSFAGVDNTAGKAFTEDFKDLKNCIAYLNGADLEDCLELEW